MEHPILIVGAGPVGLTAALALARYKVPVRLIDKEPLPNPYSKAVALHPRTLEIFESLGVIRDFLEAGHKIQWLTFFVEGKKRVFLETGSLPTAYPFIVSLPQSETETILTKHLLDLGIRVDRHCELIEASIKDDFVECTLINDNGNKETLITPYLIGCDGAHGFVRSAMGASFPGFDYLKHFVLADVTMNYPAKKEEVRGFLTPGKNILFFPLNGKDRYRVICQLSFLSKEELDRVSFSRFKEMIEEVPGQSIRILDHQWFSVFSIHHRLSDHYRDRRVFIAGDAAHVHSPVGGQGLNMGLQDVYNLAWKLASVSKGTGGERLLRSYAEERRPVAEKVLSLTDKMTDFLPVRRGFSFSVKKMILFFLGRSEKMKRSFLYRLSGLSIHYRKSSLVARGGSLFGIRSGDRFLNAFVTEISTEKERKIIDFLQDPLKHRLVIFGNRKRHQEMATFIKEAEGEFQKYLTISVIFPSKEGAEKGYLIDNGGKVAAPYRQGAVFFVLVRPDGYIGFIQKKLRTDYLRRYLVSCFGKEENHSAKLR